MPSTKQKGELTSSVAQMNGRQLLQPTCNRVPTLQKKSTSPSPKTITPLLPPKPIKHSMPSHTSSLTNDKQSSSAHPSSPSFMSSEPLSSMRMNLVPCDLTRAKRPLMKSKSLSAIVAPILNNTEYNSALSLTTSLILESPRSKQEERKSQIAHHGRVHRSIHTAAAPLATQSKKRCTFITANSDPIFVAYHDEEWGVPVHDDSLLFELLVLTGAQVGSDWTTVLKKRKAFKDAFAGFDAQVVTKFSVKQLMSVSATCGMDLSTVKGVVDNANRILEVTCEFGSLDKYFWGFVNNKPIPTNYKTTHKMPVKTSKSESISKDMMKRGFRFVGPIVIHSFTQAAGLTNGHLISCQQHAKCAAMTELQTRHICKPTVTLKTTK